MSTRKTDPADRGGRGPVGRAGPDPELLAIEERFVAEHEAGRNPRLADFMAAYPQHRAALAAFATEYLDEADGAPSEAHEAPLSRGTRRAFDLIFADAAGADEGLARVAETRAAYDARAPRLLDLARERGLSVEALAGALDLTPGLVRWLEATPLAQGELAAALIARLAGILAVSGPEVSAALARGYASTGEADRLADFRAALLADAALPDAARARWFAILDDCGE